MSELDCDFDYCGECQECGREVQEAGAPTCDECDPSHPMHAERHPLDEFIPFN